MIKTYRARRPQTIGASDRNPGELVPEAHTWFRVDSHVHTGYLTEEFISEEEFVVAVQKYCPELTEQLSDITGVVMGIIPTTVKATVQPTVSVNPRKKASA